MNDSTRVTGRADVPAYAELEVTTNFSFLEGAAHPEDLVRRAVALGHTAIAVTDRNSLAGIVRAHAAAKEAGLRLVVGARLTFADAPAVLCYPMDRAAYGRLCRLLTVGKRRAGKSGCDLYLTDLLAWGAGQIVAALPPADGGPDAAFAAHLDRLRAAFGDRLYLAARHLDRGDDAARIDTLAALAARQGVPLLATHDVRYDVPSRRALHDVLTCVRHGCTIHEAGHRLSPNAERHLKSPAAMARRFARHPAALERTQEIVARCRFDLDTLRHEYPTVPAERGRTPQESLETLTREAAATRYPEGVPERVATLLDHELDLIGQLGYAPYFLVVWDIVRFARERGILAQGRGSAANSAVCFVLGITAVDPEKVDVLFERFVSAARAEPPDIDIDFEHHRREEVIQYIYGQYGRERAGLAATVIRYRAKSALRDVGKVMGLSPDAVDALAGAVADRDAATLDDAQIRQAGLDPQDRTVRQTLTLAAELIDTPRHLSQHVGGFVIARDRLDEVAPVENAAMAGRTVIPWDKDDLDALGLLKIDVLALGMLTCIRRAFDLIARHRGRHLTLASVPGEDPGVYDMLCRADSLGVFQVESRAQMTFLPRMRPRTWYDLVIEIAIVRPGPIQGDMVHPYLRRRRGEEPVVYPSGALRDVLRKTLGVPLFQEQAMRLAIVGAGFSPSEADRLRKAMATFRKMGTIQDYRDRFLAGMAANGQDADFAERCWRQIEGFGEYGFPESHAAGFAQIAYVSAWLKHHEPAAFAAALLNSQPMGFYAPAQIVADARDHGVPVWAPDVNHSEWDCTLEDGGRGRLALRLGLRHIKGLSEAAALRLVAARGTAYATVRDLWARTRLSPAVLERLAEGDAFGSLGLDRRAALWAIHGLGAAPLPLFAHAAAAAQPGGNAPPVETGAEAAVTLPATPPGREVVADYRHLGLSLRRHPVTFLRRDLARRGIAPAADLAGRADGDRITVAGLVLVRQRPGSASGVIFATLEDETGWANVVVWPQSFERFRKDVLSARLLAVAGRVQRDAIAPEVIHLVADHLADLSSLLAHLDAEGGAYRTGSRAAMPKGRNFQ